MGASTQLHGKSVAHTQDSNLVAILLTKKRGRTALYRFVITQQLSINTGVQAHLLVDEMFYLFQMPRLNNARVSKIETQLVRIH